MTTAATLWVKLDADATKLLAALNKSEKSVKGFSSLTKTALAGVAVASAVAFAKMGAEFVKASTKMAARADTLAVVTERMGANIGLTTQEIRGFEEGIQSMGITTIASREAVAQLIRSQIDLSKSSDLARLAQNAAVIAGEDSSAAFTALSVIIATGNTLMARRRGLMVDFQGAYKELGEELGKTKEEMTDAELAQARLNEVMSKGEAISGVYEAAMETAGKKALSYKRHADELKVAFGGAFQRVFGIAIDLVTEWTKGVTESIKSGDDWFSNMEAGLDSIGSYAKGVNAVSKALDAGSMSWIESRIQLIKFGKALFEKDYSQIEFEIRGINKATEEYEEKLAIAAEATSKLTGFMDSMGRIIRVEVIPETVELKDEIKTTAEKLALAAYHSAQYSSSLGFLTTESELAAAASIALAKEQEHLKEQQEKLNDVFALFDFSEDVDEVRESLKKLRTEEQLLQDQLAGGELIISGADQQALDDAYWRIYEINQEVANLETDSPIGELVELQDEYVILRDFVNNAVGAAETMEQQTYDDLIGELGEVQDEIAEVEAAWLKQSQQMILGKLAEQAVLGGISDEEIAFIQNLGEEYGFAGADAMAAWLLVGQTIGGAGDDITSLTDYEMAVLLETVRLIGEGMDFAMASRTAVWNINTIYTSSGNPPYIPVGGGEFEVDDFTDTGGEDEDPIIIPVIPAGSIINPATGMPSFNPNLQSARALGGPVSAGQSYLVGEQGPEMFVPRSSGDIVPNNQLGGGMTKEDIRELIFETVVMVAQMASSGNLPQSSGASRLLEGL